jgi:hypothetical protein
VRKTILLAAATVAAMAAMATTANAAEIYDVQSQITCPAVSLSGNTVTGGCLVEGMDGEWNMMNPYNSPPTTVTGCMLNFDIRIGGSGTTLYAINQNNSCYGFNRVACTDNVTGEKIPWPGVVTWVPGVGVGQKVDICLESPNNPSSHNWEEVTLLPAWDWADRLVGFDQHGSSEYGSIAGLYVDHSDVYSSVGVIW